jgi:nucleotide-binding universal stress UspA family protein
MSCPAVSRKEEIKMFNKVLVPLDGSKLAECALPYLKKLASGGKVGEVILLTVAKVDIPYTDVGSGFDFGAFSSAALDKDRKYLAGMQSDLRAEGLQVETVVIEGGNPSQAIVDFSEKSSVELIVIATHGYTGMKKMLIGSVAFKVLHESHIPVLLIRPETSRK